MSRRFDSDEARAEARGRLMGLGERSARKSYYPALQDRLAELQRFRALLDEGGEGIFLVEWPSGRIVDANDSAARQLGRDRGQLLGTPLVDHLTPCASDRFTAEAVLAAPGTPQRILRLELRRADGRTFPAELGLRQVVSDGLAWLVAVSRDVTEREQMRARLAVADRMASLGTLAAGVAHEINNPLAYVIGNLEFARRELARVRRAGEPVSVAISDVEAALVDSLEGAERVRLIVRDLKSLSRASDDARAPVDLRRVVDLACSMVVHEALQRAQLVREYGGVAVVVANEGRLTQVLVNLLVNAAQAIPEGNVQGNEIRVTVAAEGEEALVEVRDTGSGIMPEHMDRIFDPFFTTKPVGLGTGLGLSICHGIIADLGGSMEVSSAPGQGTCFRVRLPRAPSSPQPAAAAQALPGAQALRARLLVVDDDPRCGKVVERLVGAVHDVTSCTSPRAALQRLESGEHFDAILCDVMMPDLDGQAFYEELDEVAPGLARRVIFISGGAFTERTVAFMRQTSAPSLAKPFEVPALLAAIELVLGR